MTSWAIACQAPLSRAFSRHEYWSGLPSPHPVDLPDPGIEPMSPTSPAPAGRFFTTSATWEAPVICIVLQRGPWNTLSMKGKNSFKECLLQTFCILRWQSLQHCHPCIRLLYTPAHKHTQYGRHGPGLLCKMWTKLQPLSSRSSQSGEVWSLRRDLRAEQREGH